MSSQFKNIYNVREEIKKSVYEAFNRNDESVKDDVETIKEWMKTQVHLPEIMEDVQIRNFLNLNKYSIEKTKKKIDTYYTIRSLIPDLYKECNPKILAIKSVFDRIYISIHPKLWNDIHRVYLLKPKIPNQLAPIESSQILINIFEFRLFEDFLNDDIFIFDFENITFNDLRKITPTILGNIVTVYQKVYSLRLKEIHFLNGPPFISVFLALLKTVLKPKIFGRMKVHPDTQILSRFFSDDDLPKDYGGKGLSLEELNVITKAKFLEYQHRYDVLDTLRVAESLRPEKLDNDEILGYYGNFKKLDVD